MSVPTGGGLPNHRRIIKDFPGVLDVVTAISNPCRYRSRYDLYRAFEKHVLDSGARLTTVEAAFGDREFEITEAGNPRHVQLRYKDEIWVKESMLNIAVSRLPSDWRAVAWVDADLTFVRPDWVQETLHQLQHYSIVQPWTQVIEVTDSFSAYDTGMGLLKYSFASQYQRAIAEGMTDAIYPCFGQRRTSAVLSTMNHKGLELRVPAETGYGAELVAAPYGAHLTAAPYGAHLAEAPAPAAPKYNVTQSYWHPGFAAAYTRDAWNTLGGLIAGAVAGAGDHHMFWSLIGHGEKSLPGGISQGYRDMVLNWQERASKLAGNIGAVDGAIVHHYHGAKALRKYTDRWKLVVEENFDPNLDLCQDWQGLIQLTGRNPMLKQRLRHYFAERREDDPYMGND